MALFNYNKPGPGIEKNTPYEANRFSLFFQLLGRKFWNICVLNLIMLLYTVPYIALSVALYHIAVRIPLFAADFRIGFVFIGLPFAFYGPVIGATSKITRDFVREEPVFLFSDFWNAVKKNLGKPMILSGVSYFFFSALTFALPAYYLTPGIGTYVLFPLCLLAAFILLVMQFYLYTMSVSFELTIKEIFKNALILAFICIGGNLLMFVVLALILILCVLMFMVALTGKTIVFAFLMILLGCLIPAFFSYTVNFITHPSLQRYIVEPFYEANPEKTSAVLNQPKPEEKDHTPIVKEIPEYVYHNGRMVHRSVLESEALFDDNRKISPDHE